MPYSPEERRKIIFANYQHPSKQLSFAELQQVSDNWQVPFATFRSLEQGCGDILHLLVIKQGDKIKDCFFSAQQACLITVAASNILCSYLKGKNINSGRELLNNCQAMVAGKEYDLSNCSELAVFSDIIKFPYRIECFNLVTRGINVALL